MNRMSSAENPNDHHRDNTKAQDLPSNLTIMNEQNRTGHIQSSGMSFDSGLKERRKLAGDNTIETTEINNMKSTGQDNLLIQESNAKNTNFF